MLIANYVDSTVELFKLGCQLSVATTFRPKLFVKSWARFAKEVHSGPYDSRGSLHPFLSLPFYILTLFSSPTST